MILRFVISAICHRNEPNCIGFIQRIYLMYSSTLNEIWQRMENGIFDVSFKNLHILYIANVHTLFRITQISLILSGISSWVFEDYKCRLRNGGSSACASTDKQIDRHVVPQVYPVYKFLKIRHLKKGVRSPASAVCLPVNLLPRNVNTYKRSQRLDRYKDT